jgi:preprotein translocase subunit SecE
MASASEASQQANRSGMDPRRLVIIFYMVAGLILALFFDHVLGPLLGNVGLRNQPFLEGIEFSTPSTLIGLALAIAIGVGSWLHPRSKALSLECASELMKVTWPSWGETRVSTMAVVIASVVASIVLFGIDAFSYRLMVEWLPALWTIVNGHS